MENKMKKLFKMLLVFAVLFITGCSNDDSVSSNDPTGYAPQVTIFSKSGLLDSIYCVDVYSYKIDNLASFKIDSAKKYVLNYKVNTNATSSQFFIAKNIYGSNTDTALYRRYFQSSNQTVNDTVRPNFNMSTNVMKYIIAVNALYTYISIRDLKIIMLYQ
jgi:hypothetical protein